MLTKIILFSSVLGLALLAAGCDSGSRVEGQIRDTKGRPIAGAQVKLSVIKEFSTNSTALTDNDGKYHTAIIHSSSRVTLYLTVEKPGYEAVGKEFYSGANPIHVDIVLEAAH
jgi:hypothetical protein